jgi:hypothetical protein
MSKVLRIFLHTDMRCAHEGLTKLASEEKVDIKGLVPGEFLVFINTAMDRIKLMAANSVVAYYKSPHGKIDLRTISKIPQAFRASGRIDYDSSLKDIIEEHLTRRGRQHQTTS